MRVKHLVGGSIIAVAALWMLGCAMDPMETLSQQIKSPDPAKRKEAVLQLANLKEPRALKLLADALESDQAIYDQAAIALVSTWRIVTPVAKRMLLKYQRPKRMPRNLPVAGSGRRSVTTG